MQKLKMDKTFGDCSMLDSSCSSDPTISDQSEADSTVPTEIIHKSTNEKSISGRVGEYIKSSTESNNEKQVSIIYFGRRCIDVGKLNLTSHSIGYGFI